MYVTPSGPSLSIGLWVPPGNGVANVSVTDWTNRGEVSARVRRLESRLRGELAESLPSSSIVCEDVDLGFWAP